MLKIVAIDAEADKVAWRKSFVEFPEDWYVGFNTDNLLEREAYSLPAMPSIYLLDATYNVVAKDISYEDLEQSLR